MIITDITACSSLFTLLLRFLEKKRSWYQAWFWCPSPPSWSGPCGGLVLLDLARLNSLLPSCSSFLAALLLLLINLWWSSKWPWSLVDWAGILVVISGSSLWCSCGVLEVRWVKGMCVRCGAAALWCLSSLGAKLVFAVLTFWSKAWLCMLILDGELFWCCHL
jgi:hypothetical protein